MIEQLLACIAGGLHSHDGGEGSGVGFCKIFAHSPLSLFHSFSVSPLPKSNMAPRQTIHRNLRGLPATQAQQLHAVGFY